MKLLLLLSLHIKYTHEICGLATWCYFFFPLRCMIEASEVDHSASYVVGCWWLVAAVLVSAASTPHLGAFEAWGHPSRIAAVNTKMLVRSIVQKERDSKPSADDRPDIGK